MPRASTTARNIAVAERRARAIELRRAGVTFQAIADQLGYRSRGAAAQDVRRALAAVVTAPAADLVTEEVDRLDAMLTGLWPAARRGHLGSVDRVLRIMERRARYLGLDHGDRDPGATPARSMIGALADALDAAYRSLPAGDGPTDPGPAEDHGPAGNPGDAPA